MLFLFLFLITFIYIYALWYFSSFSFSLHGCTLLMSMSFVWMACNMWLCWFSIWFIIIIIIIIIIMTLTTPKKKKNTCKCFFPWQQFWLLRQLPRIFFKANLSYLYLCFTKFFFVFPVHSPRLLGFFKLFC